MNLILCGDCPPADYSTDKTRCDLCPRRKNPAEQYLTADAVAVAIVAACRETKERAEDVARRIQGVRARYYACLALAVVYPRVATPQIARCCGATHSSDQSFIASVRHRLEKQNIKWWSKDSLDRVTLAVAQHASGHPPRVAARGAS